jgi:hypothetical protein
MNVDSPENVTAVVQALDPSQIAGYRQRDSEIAGPAIKYPVTSVPPTLPLTFCSAATEETILRGTVSIASVSSSGETLPRAPINMKRQNIAGPVCRKFERSRMKIVQNTKPFPMNVLRETRHWLQLLIQRSESHPLKCR